MRFRATPRHDSAFRSSLQVEGLCAAQVLPLGCGSQIEVGKVKIQRRFRSAGAGDLLLNRADRFVDVDFFGHCGSQMPTTPEIIEKIHAMKEGK